MAIYEHNNQNESRWSKGQYQVMIRTPQSERPFGYCDGTNEDEAELIATAESEGMEHVSILRKPMKSGREIWTVMGEGAGGDGDSGMDEW